MFCVNKQLNKKICLGLLLACFSFLAYYKLYIYMIPRDDYLSTRLPGLESIETNSFNVVLETKGTKEKITMLAKVIYNAQKHARGSKTSGYLNAALFIMDDILGDVEVEPETLYERPSEISTSICAEKFMGGNFGFPLYYMGFVTETCENAVPMNNLITVITYIDSKDTRLSALTKIIEFITSVNETYSNLSILIATNSATYSGRLNMEYPWVKITDTRKLTEGSALNRLIEQVTTPYVLVARNVTAMTNDSRLERLIREMESLDVMAVGGSFRDLDGHWRRGCFQTAYRNFTLKYIEGYDESFHECLFCDYIQGPFVTTKRYLKQNKFQDLNDNNGLYEDWFMRIFQNGQETVVCPDSMFNIYTSPQSNSNWKSFLQIWNLYKIFTPSGYTFSLGCEDHKISSKASRVLSPCDLQLNNEAVKLIMRICEETSVICELQEGTALGALKMGKALPWELDFDIRFLATNCTKCKILEDALLRAGLHFAKFARTCCTKKLKLGEGLDIGMRYKGYYGDFSGHPVIDSDLLTKAGVAPTKVLLDGQWVNVPRNPGLFVRNRYGKEIYQHAEHWRYSGGKHTHHRINYTTKVFLPCKYPGRHDCLDRYSADGDLQFIDLLP